MYVDEQLRSNGNPMRGLVYLHRSCQPLSEVDFGNLTQDNAEEDAFDNECEGICGV